MPKRLFPFGDLDYGIPRFKLSFTFEASIGLRYWVIWPTPTFDIIMIPFMYLPSGHVP